MKRRRAMVGALGAVALTGIFWAAAPFAAAGGGSCMHGTAPTDGSGTTVEMVASCYTPTVLHASPGDTITFVNRDMVPHMVTGVGGRWGTFDTLDPGSKVAYTFEENGVYVYVCSIHPGMAGAVVVGDGRGSAGLDPASVQPVELTADPPIALTAGSAVSSDRWMGLGLTLMAAAVLGLGMGGLTLLRRRRTAEPHSA